VLKGAGPGTEPVAEEVLERFGGFIQAYESRDLDRLMSYYAPEYRDSNGYGPEYVRRACLWWYQRTVNPYVVSQVREWDTSQAKAGTVRFTAWNLFRATMVWDEPFGYHGRVRIPRHPGERVTWTWKRNARNGWKIIETTPGLPNFGEILWNSRGHDTRHVMSEFADTPASEGQHFKPISADGRTPEKQP
jgi:hypothetical protein